MIIKKRIADNRRITKETNIYSKVNIDGKGLSSINTKIPFFDHMLDQLAKHSLIDLDLKCVGDIEIDAHHTLEDTGWCVGEAFNKALGSRVGINRYSSISLPMDETLTNCSIDISGRPWLEWRVILPNTKIGEIDAEVFQEFFRSFSQSSKITIHIENKYGVNAHHIIESCFKTLAVCLKNSLTIVPQNVDIIPSTKGTLK